MKNQLLLNQIQKYFGLPDDIPENLLPLLNAISKTYNLYEKNYARQKQSSKINFGKIAALNNSFSKKIGENKKLNSGNLRKILPVINSGPAKKVFSPSQFDYLKFLHLTELLKKETKKRKQAEKEKAQNKAYLEASQRIAHIGSWELDLTVPDNSGINPWYCSGETYSILGFDPKQGPITNELFFSRIHPDDHELLKNTFQKIIETGDIYNLEHRIILPDGIVKIVHERGEIVLDKTNKPVRIIGTMQDITERKKAAERLEKTNSNLKTLFENMQEAFFSVDMQTYQTLQMSKASEEIYGYTIEEFLQNSNLWFEVILEEDKQIINNNNDVMRAGLSFTQVYRIRHKNGSIRWLETKITPTLDKEKNLIRLDGITSDVTERKEAENALKDSEYKFRSLIENSSDAFMIINKKTEPIFISNSLCRIMGYTRQEIMEAPAFTFVYKEDLPLMKEHLKNVLNNPGKTITVVYRRIKKDGSYIWCEGTATNLLSEPMIKGIIVNFRDITDRKVYEQKLEASNEDLKKSNMELDRFVYSVSHDLRAPLSSMKGVIEFLESEVSDEQALQDIAFLGTSINKLDNFILDILDYSRNTRLEVKREKIDFKELLNDIIHNLKFMDSGNNNIDIRQQITEEAAFYSDRSRLSIIFNNIISNAIRYSNPQSSNPFIEISIKTSATDAKIIIKDNGIGIDKEDQQKVFEIFYRVSNNSTGSGLGLYIVKETIEKLNGAIQLESALGEGTAFTISLLNLADNKIYRHDK